MSTPLKPLTLETAFALAITHLPPGYHVRLIMGAGVSWVELTGPDGSEVTDSARPSPSLSRQIADCIRLAKLTASVPEAVPIELLERNPNTTNGIQNESRAS